MVGMGFILITIKNKIIMKLQELTTEELINIEGGGLLYDFFYAVGTIIRGAANLSEALSDNPNYGNAMLYK